MMSMYLGILLNYLVNKYLLIEFKRFNNDLIN